ncbi:uncharacterized protein LOC108905102 [Anoplophora glabripennis]|uniref:uncharacterized protein LOC108905102 n=1 Tax=Anoplophora glabripennis TaxID=217634 RepID=UPI000873DD5A|nr:uncharacterized protein LOC108905102 [Anoplophora glabripennis]
MEDEQVPNGKDSDLNTDTIEDIKLSGITLEDCFRSVVEGNSIEFELENLNNILKKDLQVNFYYLKSRLKHVMPYMLVHFINCWPGWQKSGFYINKQITFKSWFAKFKEYLVFKINYLIKNDYEKVSVMLKTNPPIEDSISKIDNSTQMNIPLEKTVSPYTVEIQGVPKMLNSLIFCEGPKDGIIVREYKTNPFIENLTIKQLLNWPHVEVEFLSKELNFNRKNMHEFKRFLMLSNEKITFKKIEAFIEEVEIINKQLNRTVYTLNVWREYCNTYIDVLRKHTKIMEITDEYIGDIKALFDELLMDITELNMGSMATNTSVLFNIGSYIYARNKSVRTSGQAVSFAESITPKVNVSLFSFTGLKDEESDTPFQDLQNALDSTDKDLIQSFLPLLKYGCTYCDRYYNNKQQLLHHFKDKHCMEQPVLCFKCKLEMDVGRICSNRWTHQCRSKDTVGTSVTR